MSSILGPDDMEVGMCITVLKGAKFKKPKGFNPFSMFEFDFSNYSKNSDSELEENKDFNGLVLKIEAIDFPYIITSSLLHGKHRPPFIFDTRDGWEFKKLNENYVDFIKNIKCNLYKEGDKDEH